MRATTLAPLLAASILVLPGCKKNDASAAADGGSSSSGSVVAAVASALGLGFEGDVTMHVTSVHDPAPQDLVFHVKGQKLRVDVPAQHGEQAHVIFDQAANKTYAILDTQKMYVEMDHASPAAAAAHASQPAKATPTGKHETIAGTDCEDWEIVENGGKKAEVCIAHGIAFFDFGAMRPGGAPQHSWMDELRMKQAFPLKAVETDASGKELSRMEVTKIEKKSLDDSLFAIPAGYRSMSSMMPGGFPHPGMPGGPVHPR